MGVRMDFCPLHLRAECVVAQDCINTAISSNNPKASLI